MSREMKDSGVAWIGEMPSEWRIYTVGSLFDVRNEKVNDSDYPPLSVTRGGVVPQMENVAKSDANDNRKQVLKNDFVINSRSDRKQSCGVSSLDGSVSLINTVLFTKNNTRMISRYPSFLMKNYGFAEEFYRWGHGIVADLWTTRWQEMKNICLPVPTIDEQKRILDEMVRRTQKIDKLIDNQQRQTEKLKLYRKAIITEVTTKGLDLEVVTKENSLANCLVPEHWEDRKIITVLSMRVIDGPHESPNLQDDGIPYISATAIVNGKIDFSLMRGYISEEYCDLCDQRYKPQIDDILVIKLGASTGQVAIVETEKRFNIWVPLAAVRCDAKKAIPKFIYYAFQSDYFIKEMELSWTFGTQQTLGVKTIEQLRVILPPIDEQQQIVNYLDMKCSKIDALIAIKEKKIEKLNQYKRSIIYEYVTGKKEA